MTGRMTTLVRWAVIIGLLAVRGNALAAPPTGAGSEADRLADGLAVGEASADTPGVPAAKAPVAKVGMGTVSVLDVGAKLALLVLAVYGIAYGLKTAQRSGFSWRGPAAQGAPQRRLRALEELPLRAGVALHLVEVDGQTLVVATAPGGAVSVVLEAGTEITPVAESAPTQISVEDVGHDTSTLRDDADWQARRETLIRALSSQTT